MSSTQSAAWMNVIDSVTCLLFTPWVVCHYTPSPRSSHMRLLPVTGINYHLHMTAV